MNDFDLLAGLWLREPDQALAQRGARALGTFAAPPEELAVAYTGLFLLNVYPYGTAFTGPAGELNGPGAQWLARRYAAEGYAPAALAGVGAPDHLGLALGFLAHLSTHGRAATLAEVWTSLLDWAPPLCLAVLREPGVHAFYRALAAHTAGRLLAGPDRPGPGPSPHNGPPDTTLELSDAHAEEPEVRLRDVLSFWLAPARCGLFLSRGRLGQLAQALGLRLPFGSRYAVAEALFTAAGENERVPVLLDLLGAQLAAWEDAYRQWAERYPAWRAAAAIWLARTNAGQAQLEALRATAREELLEA